MKKVLQLFLILTITASSALAQTVTRTYVAPSSVSIDNVGNYGESLPSVSFASGDFTDGCAVTDVDVIISWAKTDGTCASPGFGDSRHHETSFRINHPTAAPEILAVAGTWSGATSTSSVVTTFSDGNPIPTGIPVTGTFGPNNGVLANYNGISPFGAWNLDAGDNGASDPLCLDYYQVVITTAADNTAPVLTIPSDITVNADPGNCSAVVNYTAPTATDLCGATVTRTAGPASGDVFPAGPTIVTYEATDPYGNVTTESFTVTVTAIESVAPTSVTASTTNICGGDPVVLTVNGGLLGSGAQWFWYVGSCGGQLVGAGSSITVNPLTTTTYYVLAGGPCNITTCAEVLIDVTASPSVGFCNVVSPSACGASDGSIEACAIGGTSPYTYNWGGTTGAIYNGLAAGPYQVTVTDASGCTDVASVALSDPGAEVTFLTSSDGDNSICAGETVTFTATGAFQYQFYVDGVAVSTQNPYVTNTLQDGETVHVVGIDFNFCSYTAQGIQFEVLENPIIDETITDPSACAVSDGSIATSVSGGLPLYDYLWVGGATSSSLINIPAGPYFLTVTDDNGCSTTETYGLNDPGASPVTMTSSEDPNNEICAGESITFTASGSVDYEFFVDGISETTTNPFTTSTLTDAQSVVVTGTDASNCTATSNIIYPIVNPGPVISLVSDVPGDTICIGASVSFFAAGGLVYEFFVDGNSQGPSSPTSVFTTSSLTNGQTVTVIGTDGFQCDVVSDTVTVTVRPSPTVSIITVTDPSSCGASDGNITADATGGTPNYTYTWSNAGFGPTIANLNAGSYFVEVTDNAGCTAVSSASLSDVGSTPVSLTSTANNNAVCGGETVTFTATGASTYVYYINGVQASTDNPFMIDSLVDGDIVAVTGLDTTLCSATSAPETYTVYPGIQVGITSFINPTACGAADGEANALVVGGTSLIEYLWTPGGQTTPTAVNLTAGPYAVTVTDANGCQASDAVGLSDPGTFAISLTADPTGLVLCEGTSVEFTATGGDTYEFYTGGTLLGTANPYLLSNVVDGETITVVATDTNNCTATSVGLTYQVLSVPAVSLTFPLTTCSNEDTVLFTGGVPLGGDYTVVYGNVPVIGDLFFPDLAGAGSINVDYTYTSSNGCATTVSENYLVLQAPEIDLGNDTTVCAITLDAGVGYASYSWTPTGDSTATTFADVTGVYEVTVADANGCIGVDQIGISVNPIPAPTITADQSLVFCIGDSVVLSSPGYDGYAWSTSSTDETITVYTSDTITLVVTNQFGCEGTAEVITVMNEPQPGAVITADGPLEFCIGGSVGLDAGPGYASYLWSHGATVQVINVIESGQYTVIVLDGNGCIDSSMVADPVVVTVINPEPIVAESGDVLSVTNASDFVSFQWFFNGDTIGGATSDSYDIEGKGSGNYMVCVTDADGCYGCSFIYEMTCCVGIEEALFDGDVYVYPNPNSGQFTLEVEMQSSVDMSVGLYDMVGKQVWLDQGLGNTNSLRKQYDMSEIPDGVYFIRIYADDQMTVQKLIKQQ